MSSGHFVPCLVIPCVRMLGRCSADVLSNTQAPKGGETIDVLQTHTQKNRHRTQDSSELKKPRLPLPSPLHQLLLSGAHIYAESIEAAQASVFDAYEKQINSRVEFSKICCGHIISLIIYTKFEKLFPKPGCAQQSNAI